MAINESSFEWAKPGPNDAKNSPSLLWIINVGEENYDYCLCEAKNEYILSL